MGPALGCGNTVTLGRETEWGSGEWRGEVKAGHGSPSFPRQCTCNSRGAIRRRYVPMDCGLQKALGQASVPPQLHGPSLAFRDPWPPWL